MYLDFDYFLRAGILMKEKIDDKKHLLFIYGGTPAIDEQIWNDNEDKIKKIRIKTKKGKIFKTDKDTFNRNKELINLGFGNQYAMPIEFWTVE